MQSSGLFTTAIVAVGDFFRKVVAVLFQTVAGVQVGFLGAIRDRREVTDAEVDARRFGAGCIGRLDLIFTDEV